MLKLWDVSRHAWVSHFNGLKSVLPSSCSMSAHVSFLPTKTSSPVCSYILNLAVADAMLLFCNIPTTVKHFLSKEEYIELTDFWYCTYTSPFNIITMLAALHSAGAVSMNRWERYLCLWLLGRKTSKVFLANIITIKIM